VIQALDDPRQIAQAIAITVLIRARIDLVNDAFLPPKVMSTISNHIFSFQFVLYCRILPAVELNSKLPVAVDPNLRSQHTQARRYSAGQFRQFFSPDRYVGEQFWNLDCSILSYSIAKKGKRFHKTRTKIQKDYSHNKNDYQ
jgi:hypothetical protein